MERGGGWSKEQMEGGGGREERGVKNGWKGGRDDEGGDGKDGVIKEVMNETDGC